MHEFGGKEARKAAQCSSRVEARAERLHLHPEACWVSRLGWFPSPRATLSLSCLPSVLSDHNVLQLLSQAPRGPGFWSHLVHLVCCSVRFPGYP